MSMGTCRGIDVSAYQAAQNWSDLRTSSSLVFAVAKASEGNSSQDSRFATHIKGIKAAGLVPGSYHFAWPNESVADNASNYISTVSPYAGPGYTHWLDLESYSDGRNYTGTTAAGIKAWASSWLTRVQNAFPGQRVGIYTSASDISSGHVPTDWPLWYPAYPSAGMTYAQAEAHARPVPSGRTVTIWQFTSTPLDRDLAYMSEDEFRAWADPEDDMADLTQANLDAIASAVVSKLIASGGVLENSDLSRIYTYLLKTDGVIPSPPAAGEQDTNPFWAWQTHITQTTEATLEAAAGVAALQTAAAGLKDQLTALQTDLDLATIQTRLQDMINSVTVTLHAEGS